MNKNLIIAAVVVVVLLGGFVAYRQTKGQSEASKHDEKVLAVLLKNAKANDKAGLADMARALKAFHKDTKAYPPNLQALYPKYIPLKAFIEEINWSYQGRGDGFVVTKSVDIRGRTMVASIDQDMKISGTGATRVAVGPAAQGGAGVAAAPTLTLEQVLKPLEMASRPDQPGQQGTAAPLAIRREPRTVEADAALDPLGLAGRTSRDLLVWRKADGSLGFGNVQYPRAEQLYVAVSDHWYRISRIGTTAVPAALAASAPPAGAADEGQTPSPFVQTVRGEMLVWRIDDGSLGFGNVQYPLQTPIRVAGPKGWDAFKGAATPAPRPTVQPQPAGKTAADREPSTLGLSERYLAWKDKNGVIGFGNVQYPGNDVAFIHANGRWEKAAN